MISISVQDDLRATINIRPSAKTLLVVQSLEGRRKWLTGGGLSFEPTRHNIEILASRLEASVENAVDQVAQEFEPRPSPYSPKTRAMPHQLRAMERMKGMKHFALLMKQGTGKTWVALTRAGMLWAYGEITGCLILSKKGPHKQWVVQQIPEHYGAACTSAFWPNKPAGQTEGIEFFSINVEALRDQSSKGFDAASTFIDRHQGKVLMVFDESHQIKNHATASWKSSKVLGQKCARRMILTGTPIASNLEEAWSQFRWLDESIIGIRYATSFRSEFCVMGGFDGKQVVGSKNVQRFTDLIAPFSFTVSKDELGLLPKTYARWEFNVTPAQSRMIKDIKRSLKEKIEASQNIADIRENGAGAIFKVQQISNGFVYNEDGSASDLFTCQTDNPRCAALGEIIDCIDGPVIIWAKFRRDIENITSFLRTKYPSEKTVRYFGDSTKREKDEAVESFLGGAARFFVANAASAGTGLNLQSGGCQNAIYYSNSDNSIERWQSEDRIHRIGMAGPAQYWDIVANKGIDRAILRRLSSKASLSSAVLQQAIEEIED